MAQATVLVTHPADRLATYFGQRAEAGLRGVVQVRLNPLLRDLSEEELIAAAQGCDALIAYRQTPAPATLFAALPKLAVFLRCAMDIRTVDVAAASAHGVLVTRASAGFNAAVAEWIVAAMINLGRGIGSTLGRLGLALGMQLLVTTPEPVAAQPNLRQVPLAELLAGADFIACLAPAHQHTTRLIDAAAFALMKPGAYFVNASRGELVDEAALLAALDSGHIAGCALDVGMAPDQMPSAHLARHPRVIATPHIGGLTLPAIEHQALEVVAQLQSLLQGRLPDGAVNAEHATRWRLWSRSA